MRAPVMLIVLAPVIKRDAAGATSQRRLYGGRRRPVQQTGDGAGGLTDCCDRDAIKMLNKKMGDTDHVSDEYNFKGNH